MTDRPAPQSRLVHADITDRIIKGFFETGRELGCGFNEVICRRALAVVLRANGLEVAEEVSLPVWFRGQIIGSFRADIVVADTVLVEVKTLPVLDSHAEAQMLNYLKAAGGGVGLLVNFGRGVSFKRLVMGDDPAKSLPSLKAPHPVDPC